MKTPTLQSSISPMFNHFLTNPVDLEIDYTKSLDEMIQDGEYTYKAEKVSSKRFSLQCIPSYGYLTQLTVFSFFLPNPPFSFLSTEEIIKVITTSSCEGGNWKPAYIEHLLAFDLHTYFQLVNEPIVALGDSIALDGQDHFATTSFEEGGKRGLELSCPPMDNKWLHHDHKKSPRFLAFK